MGPETMSQDSGRDTCVAASGALGRAQGGAHSPSSGEHGMMQKQQVRYCISEYVDPFPSCSSDMKMKHGCKMYTSGTIYTLTYNAMGSQG